jgi:hypothetical protein
MLMRIIQTGPTVPPSQTVPLSRRATRAPPLPYGYNRSLVLTLLVLAVQLLQSSGPPTEVKGDGAPVVTIPRIEAAATIDGTLDEPAWSQAVRLVGFWQYSPVDGRAAEEETVVLLWYAPDALHVGIIAKDRDPGSIRATMADRDNLDREDHVTIYLDTFNDRRRAFFFTVNALGVQQDGMQTEGQFTAGQMFGSSQDRNPDYRFDSKGRVVEDGYVVEMRIPFKSLRYPSAAEQRWRVNVRRKIQRTGYEDTWTDARRANASFLAQSAEMTGLRDLRRGVVTELQPFVTGVTNGARTASGRFERDPGDFDAGANVRFGFTNMAVDATVNPDFSQVESDASQVTVNERFALFYPEKRPFFLEGIELFSTPNRLVYTRRIVDPIVGGKFTGKFGAYGVAYLNAVDQSGERDAVFNVARIRRDLGRNSLAGVTYTDRTAAQGANRVIAADARWVFREIYFVQGQVGGSWTSADGADTRRAAMWEGQLDRTGRAWGYNYRLTGFGQQFDAASGFVPRSGIVEASAFNRFSYYGAKGAQLETVTTIAGPTLLWRYADFGRRAPIEGNEFVSTTFGLRGGWNLSNNLRHDFVEFDPALYARYMVQHADGTASPYDHPEDSNRNVRLAGSVTTPVFQRLNARLEVTHGGVPIFPEAADGRETRISMTLGLRPTGSIRADWTTTISHLSRRRDGSEFARTILPRLKLEYQPRRALFFRAITEYRSERQASLEHAITGEPLLIGGLSQPARDLNGLRLDLLAAYEPTPGTVAYIGYGSTLAGVSTLDFTDLTRTSDGFFVKLAYQFRR